MSKSVYSNPQYYELAFSFVDPKKQVSLFEDFIAQYSKIPVKKVLDIGCGPSLQLREFARRDYRCIGLDLNKKMLNYLGKKAKKENLKIKTVNQNMKNFSLEKKVDFAFIMMGTIGNFQSNEEMYGHLNSVADNLKSGGLYLIENFSLDWREKVLFEPQEWTIEKDGIEVATRFSLELKNIKKQLLREELKLKVNDHGSKKVFEEKSVVKLIFPQEFLEIMKRNNKFEFIGWFQRNKAERLKTANRNNIALLRRI